jgi:pseudaminic acid cytidylyltransferase
MKIAIIPARGGSTRIPRKNIKPFCGKPIIAWSIETAITSGCFDRIIVSTDDDEIAEVAEAYGASAPFRRPPELSDSHTGTMPVIRHALEWLQEYGESPEFVCCIHATAPFMLAEDLIVGLQRLQAGDCDYAFPVTTFPFPIQRALRINEASRVDMFQPEHFHTRSQDLEEAYHDAAQFWWGRTSAWLAETPVYSIVSATLRIPRQRVQDIDTPEDWERAQALFQLLVKQSA